MQCTSEGCAATSRHLVKIQIVSVPEKGKDKTLTAAEFDVCHAHACEILSMAETVAPRVQD